MKLLCIHLSVNSYEGSGGGEIRTHEASRPSGFGALLLGLLIVFVVVVWILFPINGVDQIQRTTGSPAQDSRYASINKRSA